MSVYAYARVYALHASQSAHGHVLRGRPHDLCAATCLGNGFVPWHPLPTLLTVGSYPAPVLSQFAAAGIPEDGFTRTQPTHEAAIGEYW